MESPARQTRRPRWPFLLALSTVLADQVTKQWAVERLTNPPDVIRLIPGIFHLSYAENTGAAFSILEGHTRLLSVFSVVVFGLMIVFRDQLFKPTRLEQSVFGLVMGGVVGNMLDRMRLEYVVDFIHWHWAEKNWHWPVFNLADSFICVGVGLYMLSGLVGAKTKPAAPEEA